MSLQDVQSRLAYILIFQLSLFIPLHTEHNEIGRYLNRIAISVRSNISLLQYVGTLATPFHL